MKISFKDRSFFAHEKLILYVCIFCWCEMICSSVNWKLVPLAYCAKSRLPILLDVNMCRIRGRICAVLTGMLSDNDVVFYLALPHNIFMLLTLFSNIHHLFCFSLPCLKFSSHWKNILSFFHTNVFFFSTNNIFFYLKYEMYLVFARKEKLFHRSTRMTWVASMSLPKFIHVCMYVCVWA